MRMLVAVLALFLSALPGWGSAAVHHQLTVSIEPGTHRIEVEDVVALPAAGDAAEALSFTLAAALEIVDSNVPLDSVPLGEAPPAVGLDGEGEPSLPIARYRLREAAPDGALRLRYRGSIGIPVSDLSEQYSRGFRQTPGWIGPEGVYLAGSSHFVPRFGDEMLTFELSATGPPGWQLVSQGAGGAAADGSARWVSAEPMEEVFLVGGPLQRFRETVGAVEAEVFLHDADQALASRYLEATGRYLEMYRRLIGPYPYAKFALVENFWETGYGMPSFALLGPEVIRLPFILHSSYPHEILHNWWGNGVFVDPAGGNWAEGLTAYLADHLIQEQRGTAAAYRRDTLKRYQAHVRDGRDFPLAEFRARHSASTEAIGYGKSSMGFHMLRRQLGDEVFRSALSRFYRQHRGGRASFADLRRAFEEASGSDLSELYAAWVERAGAPRLVVDRVESMATAGGYELRGRLRQEPASPPFPLQVPVAVWSAGGVVESLVQLDTGEVSFAVRLADAPLRLAVDPQFDLFRLLDAREVAPSIGQLFGAPRVLALLAAADPEERRAGYRAMLEAWRKEEQEIEIRLDREIDELPADRAVWLLGREHRFAGLFDGDRRGDGAVWVAGEGFPFAGHATVLVVRHPSAADEAVGWIVADRAEALPGLARKLPHYGKYSRLAFAGEEPQNVAKEVGEATDSPLVVELAKVEQASLAALPARRALAELPPLFSEEALRDTVAAMTDPALEGRGVGTAGLARAADLLVERFAAAGLRPVAEEGFEQRFTITGPGGAEVPVANLLGVLPGQREEWRQQAIVVSAHYDHLGRGWPDVHAGDEGEIHPGADDNASGVAVLLELARVLAAGPPPERTILFAAFTAEEAGRAGSRHFVEHPLPVALAEITAVVNLDTVGRLGGGPLQVLGAGSATEWPHVVRGVGWVTGIDGKSIDGGAQGSDQQSFLERGIPGIQLFTGAHDDYHRPSDLPADVDISGLVRVATFAKEVVDFLTSRAEPLTATIAAGGGEASQEPAAGGRRVRLGTVPDFAFPGPGVRVEEVATGSPAAAAGLRAGDVLLAINEQPIADLRGYSEVLRSLEPGQTVRLTVERQGESLLLEAVVVAR